MHCRGLMRDTRGDAAVVEATILFPIMIMIFAGLVILAQVLPTRAVLQRATQYAANAIATERGDTWLQYDQGRMDFVFTNGKDALPPEKKNVYVAAIQSLLTKDYAGKADAIVTKLEQSGRLTDQGELRVQCQMVNYVIYQEIAVTATRTVPSPVDLSFVGFPKEIPITVTSRAAVLNGDEFVRNMDIAADLVAYLDQKFHISDSEFFQKFKGFVDKTLEFLAI